MLPHISYSVDIQKFSRRLQALNLKSIFNYINYIHNADSYTGTASSYLYDYVDSPILFICIYFEVFTKCLFIIVSKTLKEIHNYSDSRNFLRHSVVAVYISSRSL